MGCGLLKNSSPSNQSKANLNQAKTSDAIGLCGTFNDYVDNYLHIQKIGSGGYSSVFLAKFRPSGILRAVKLIEKENTCKQQLDSVHKLSEFAILRELHHRNIIKSYGLYQDCHTYYLPLEYCEGQTLIHRIKNENKFNELQAAEIAFQILEGLSYMHSKNIIHRDIKPENILLISNENLDLKIADLGSAIKIKNSKGVNGCYGTSYYIAPDMIKGKYNEKVDLWSLGILLYVIVKMNRPYSSIGNEEIVKEILQTPFQVKDRLLSGNSRYFIDFLKALLELDPSNRLSANEALNHPWIVISRSPDSMITIKNAISSEGHSKALHYISAFLIYSVSMPLDRSTTICLKVFDKNKVRPLTQDCVKTLKLAFDLKKINEIGKNLSESTVIDFSAFCEALVDVHALLPMELMINIFESLDYQCKNVINLNDIITENISSTSRSAQSLEKSSQLSFNQFLSHIKSQIRN